MTEAHSALLAAHLRGWLGTWPPDATVDVFGTALRERPGWDGTVARLVGVGTPHRTLLSVPPDRASAVAEAAGPLDDRRVRSEIVRALDAGEKLLGRGVFRWSHGVAAAAALPDVGDWVDRDDDRVPAWLRPFNYPQVLIAWDGDGEYGAGVGIKRHDSIGHELAVVTTARLQGRGLARRLVAQAARRILDEGGLPTYLHDERNTASARVADAVGFPDRGWSVYGLFERTSTAT
jgi:RimJ/RimL family protein N-acetyltransferase